MKMKIIVFSAVLAGFTAFPSYSQKHILQPVGIGEYMGEFSLPTLQGDQVSFSDYYGKKNVLLVFPRGKVLDDLWCPLCFYQYAELAKWTREKNIKESQNLEILFVLPYSRDSVMAWTHAANNGLKTLENWKNPVGYDTLTGPIRNWADYMREFYPDTYYYENGVMETPIPILIDEDKKVSKSLALYTQEWGGTNTDQNMPTVFLTDKTGKVRFKYHSQYTNDRPSTAYLEEIMKILDLTIPDSGT